MEQSVAVLRTGMQNANVSIGKSKRETFSGAQATSLRPFLFLYEKYSTIMME